MFPNYSLCKAARKINKAIVPVSSIKVDDVRAKDDEERTELFAKCLDKVFSPYLGTKDPLIFLDIPCLLSS